MALNARRDYGGGMRRFRFLNSEMGLVGLVTLPVSAIAWLIFRKWRSRDDV
jgi:hypothetical protein